MLRTLRIKALQLVHSTFTALADAAEAVEAHLARELTQRDLRHAAKDWRNTPERIALMAQFRHDLPEEDRKRIDEEFAVKLSDRFLQDADNRVGQLGASIGRRFQ